MVAGAVTETGKLKDKFLPAVYFDSSVVIDYFMTEEWREIDPLLYAFGRDYWVQSRQVNYEKSEWEQKHEELLYEKQKFIKKLLRADARLAKVAEIKDKLNSGQTKATAVISPICILELVEWYAEARFKQSASEAASVIYIQRKSKKEIGDYLAKLLSIALSKQTGAKDGMKVEDTLFLDTFLSPHHAESQGLRGLLWADIVNFDLPSASALHQTPTSAYAYVQMGTTDILHVLFAQHLGCNYIASFDKDFQRVRQIIKLTTNMELLCSPEEILKII